MCVQFLIKQEIKAHWLKVEILQVIQKFIYSKVCREKKQVFKIHRNTFKIKHKASPGVSVAAYRHKTPEPQTPEITNRERTGIYRFV